MFKIPSNNKKNYSGQCLNPLNDFIYKYFLRQKLIAEKSNYPQYRFIIAKVIRSLQSYPLPIFSSKQALMIDGIGVKFANKIQNLINKQYSKFLNNDSLQLTQNIEKNQQLENSLFEKELFNVKKSKKKQIQKKQNIKNDFQRKIFTILDDESSDGDWVPEDHREKQTKKENFIASFKQIINKSSLGNEAEKNSEKNYSNLISQKIEKPSLEQLQILPKIYSKDIKDINIIIYIDNREIKNKEERQFIAEQLSLNKNLFKVEEKQLPLGDYLWVVEVVYKNFEKENEYFTANYIVERKTANDLSQSIQDGRYAEQKYRLKQSKLQCPIYIIEGKLQQNQGNKNISQEKLDYVTLKTRMQNFKVRQTNNIEETISFLNQMTVGIINKYKNELQNQEIMFDMTYKEFVSRNTSFSEISTQNQFGKMLRQIPKCGKQAITKIIDHFQTPISLFLKLMSQKSISERIAIFKNIGLNIQISEYITKIFCLDLIPNDPERIRMPPKEKKIKEKKIKEKKERKQRRKKK